MSDVVAKVVEIKERPGSKTIDLRKDNRIGTLLDEYEDAVILYLEAKRVRDELYAEIKKKMSGAEVALVEGWRLKMPWTTRAAHMVREATFQRLFLKRRWPRKGADSPTL